MAHATSNEDFCSSRTNLHILMDANVVLLQQDYPVKVIFI